MKPVYFSIFLGLLFISCLNTPEEKSVYIGGEIINPKSNVVVLMKREQVIDSIFLNSENTFGAKIPIESEGLYYFKHGNEFQYLFLEPKDSLKLRLNTWDFDETLVFGGKGSQKNELLLDLFLVNEKELENFYSYFSFSENEFQQKIDEARIRHTELLSSLKNSDIHLSNQFLHLAQSAIDYPLYRLKEIYPFYHKKVLQLDTIAANSDNFYTYHKDLNLNDTFLSEYYAYQNFVSAHLYNLALRKNNGVSSDINFYTYLLESITEKIEIPDFKNRLLHQEIDNLFFNKPTLLDMKHLTLFYDNCTDSSAISSMKQLLSDKIKLPKNSVFPDFEVNSTKDESIYIQSLIKNKSVALYFWNEKTVSNEYLIKRIGYLNKKFPNITFIGIKTDNSEACASSVFYKLENQYYLTPASDGNELVSNKYPRAILIQSNGKVLNSFALLSNYYIEKELKALLAN